MAQPAGHLIPVETAVTLDGLFRERVKRTPDSVAYRVYNENQNAWRDLTWAEVDHQVARWQAALEKDGVKAGDRVAVMLRNCPEWVIYDQAALGLGLVVVPLYTQDRPENVAYIIHDSGSKVLLIEGAEQWQALSEVKGQLGSLVRILTLHPVPNAGEPRLRSLGEWLPDQGGATRHVPRDPHALATIVYTSGTTGRPKGVMLSHHNMLSNAAACCDVLIAGHDDLFLSFLPLSHTFERTCGYYLTVMTGSTTAYARSVLVLADDLQKMRPTILVSVPRIYERVYGRIRAALDEGLPLKKKLFQLAVEIGYARFEHAQGRGPWKPSFLLWPILNTLVAKKILARLGGRMRAALSRTALLAFLSNCISRSAESLGSYFASAFTAPTATRSNTDLPRYWSANWRRRSSVMPTTRIGSSCRTIATPEMRPARSNPMSVLIGLPEYAGMRTTSPVRKT